MRLRLAVFLTLACAVHTRAAEPLELFRASTAPVEVWGWGAARVDRAGPDLACQTLTPGATHGDAYVDQRFPRVTGAEIVLDIASVSSGAYTLQVLGMKGDTVLGFAEPFKDATDPGVFAVQLGELDLPDLADAVMFKLWITQGPGTRLTVRDLIYRLPDGSARTVQDLAPVAPAPTDVEHLQVRATPEGLALSPAAGKDFGSLALPGRVHRAPGQQVLLHLAALTKGTLAVQALAFDAGGAYLGGIEIGRIAGAGWHLFELDAGTWPEGSATAGFKFWLEGPAEAGVTIQRIAILGPPQP